MWEKTRKVKSCRNSTTYRFKCKECGLEIDSQKEPKKCDHNYKFNIENIWNEIVRSTLGLKGNRKRIPINITKKFIVDLFNKQNGKCAISGEVIALGLNASLDRKDSSLGYVKGNVQWVTKSVNLAKGMFQEDFFIDMCHKIAENNVEGKVV